MTLLLAFLIPLLLAGGTAAAWAIDTRGDTTTRRGVELDGVDVGGMTRDELERRIRTIAEDFADTAVAVNGGDQKLDTTAGKLGLELDVTATADAAMAAGRNDPGPVAPLRWIKAVLVGRPVAIRLSLARGEAIRELERLEGDRRTEPTEPRLEVQDGKVTALAGQPGGGLDLDDALNSLPRQVVDLEAPLIVGASPARIPTRISDAAATMLAARANEITAQPMELKIGEKAVAVDGAAFRPGFSLLLDGETPTLQLDPTLVAKVLAQVAPVGFNPTGATFRLENGQMQPVAGHDAVICCTDEAPKLIVAALLAGERSVTLPTKTISAADGVAFASSLGVKEPVGEFTTRHPAGQPRVKNIHRIADLVRGAIIPAGGTFSINEFVGRRTAEKGFVSAPVIDEGQFKDDIGGGVSQFATTLFNAAFFAGLDIPEHKAHSIYISRYPFGREATLAYPSVDLKIRNNSPYGVVIWPTYTNGSITVQLWSTRFAIGAQSGQNKKSGCGKVTVTRTRLFVDGHTDEQTYHANYNCNPPEH